MGSVTILPEMVSRKKAKKEVAQGLCVTCVHSATCCFPRDAAEPVVHCEEFDGHAPAMSAELESRMRTVEVVEEQPEQVKAAEPQYTGLCVNCEKRTNCAFAAGNTIIWHCEEYE